MLHLGRLPSTLGILGARPARIIPQNLAPQNNCRMRNKLGFNSVVLLVHADESIERELATALRLWGPVSGLKFALTPVS